MDIAAKITSKGQITIPKPVREALGLAAGDRVVFRIDEQRAVLARVPDLLDLADSVDVPAARRGTGWENVRRRTRNVRAARTADSGS